MTAFIVATIAYFAALWAAGKLLSHFEVDLPRGLTRWLLLNTFALLVAYGLAAFF